MLGWADRLAGGAAGIAGAVVIAGSFVLPVVSYAPAGERLVAESHLAPYVTVGADLAAALVPEELAQQYRARMDTVRGSWEERAAGLRSRRRPGPGPAAPVEVPGPSLPWRVSVAQLSRFGLQAQRSAGARVRRASTRPGRQQWNIRPSAVSSASVQAV